MDAAIKVLTLGVADLERSVRFYRDGMGLATDGIVGTEFEGGAVAFFELRGGLLLALYPFEHLAGAADLPAASGTAAAPSFTIGHNVWSREEADAVLEQARAAGASYVQPGRERAFGGYTGHFRDPDGHLWEVVYNPHILPE